jgi:hypothetical protein
MSETLQEFTTPASEEALKAVAERLRDRNLTVLVVDDGASARDEVLARLPAGAESALPSRRRSTTSECSRRCTARAATTRSETGT